MTVIFLWQLKYTKQENKSIGPKKSIDFHYCVNKLNDTKSLSNKDFKREFHTMNEDVKQQKIELLDNGIVLCTQN